jgi:hypothetical protein
MDGLCDLGLEVREIFLFSACNPAMHVDVRETHAPVDSFGRLSRMNRIASSIFGMPPGSPPGSPDQTWGGVTLKDSKGFFVVSRKTRTSDELIRERTRGSRLKPGRRGSLGGQYHSLRYFGSLPVGVFGGMALVSNDIEPWHCLP